MEEKYLVKRDHAVWTKETGLVHIHLEIFRFGKQPWHISTTTDSGADLETIAKIDDDLAFLMKMHLRDYPSGLPMHAVANGAYWLREYLWPKEKSKEEAEKILRDHFYFPASGKYFEEAFQTLLATAEKVFDKFRGQSDDKWLDDLYKALHPVASAFFEDYADWFEDTANRAKEIMEEWEPDVDEEYDSESPYIKMDDGIYQIFNISRVGFGEIYDVDLGSEHYYVAEDSEVAGEAAREYWAEMAENDPQEFSCIVGEKTLVAWSLGQSAGPGTTQVSSLEEWLDLWLDTPEEEWARYDGKERAVEVNRAAAEEMGLDIPDDEEWISVVAYKQ